MSVWGLFPKLTSFLCFRQFHWCPDGKREKKTFRVVFQIRSARETPALITNNNPYQQRKKAWLKRPWQEMVSRGDLGLAEGPVCGDTMHSIWRERILRLPNRNRMQTSHQICFFHGFFFLPFSLLAEVRRDQHAAKGGQLWLHPAVPQGGRTTKEPLAKGWQARLALPHLGHAHLKHQQDWIIWGRKSH